MVALCSLDDSKALVKVYLNKEYFEIELNFGYNIKTEPDQTKKGTLFQKDHYMKIANK